MGIGGWVYSRVAEWLRKGNLCHVMSVDLNAFSSAGTCLNDVSVRITIKMSEIMDRRKGVSLVTLSYLCICVRISDYLSEGG